MKLSMTLLWVANVIALASLLLAPIACFVTFFFFDAPGSERDPFIIGMALGVWSYPITVTLGGYFALKAYKAGDTARMLRWTLCTYSSLIFFLLCFGGLALSQTIQFRSNS